ncbi:MAG TPA: immunity 53 family protein [Bryobacteraceae bacterium]|jgi:hypothetical protein|nr:immunity 53 family protein [Bryobacteraceae bacterium]
MTSEKHVLDFLQKWYLAQCNGEWEQIKGVTIETLETPGWMVTIDLAETPLENVPMEPVKVELGPNDWIDCQVETQQFRATGDSSKLIAILGVFEKWASRAQQVE